MRSKGEWLGAVPFGYRLANGFLVEDPSEQEIIAALKRDRKARHLSVRELAAKYGLPKSTVHDILRRGALKARSLTASETGAHSALVCPALPSAG